MSHNLSITLLDQVNNLKNEETQLSQDLQPLKISEVYFIYLKSLLFTHYLGLKS